MNHQLLHDYDHEAIFEPENLYFTVKEGATTRVNLSATDTVHSREGQRYGFNCVQAQCVIDSVRFTILDLP